MNHKKTSVNNELETVAMLNREHFGSQNWTVAHVRLGELQVRYLTGFEARTLPMGLHILFFFSPLLVLLDATNSYSDHIRKHEEMGRRLALSKTHSI